MKIALFLGAGASVSFGKPTTLDFKQLLSNRVTKTLEGDILQTLLEVPEFTDVEHVFQAIKKLTELNNNHAGTYFSYLFRGGFFSYRNGQPVFEGFRIKLRDVENTIKDEVFNQYSWNVEQNTNVLHIYDEIFGLLQYQTTKIHVFTTNYDRAIEQYCNLRINDFSLVDGFKRNPPESEFSKWTGDFTPVEQNQRSIVYLYKLHGSLNWKLHATEGLVKTNEEGKPNDLSYTNNALIFPTLSPKEEEQTEPFNTIIEEFHNFLNDADICIVIGYSFRDSLNDTFKKFVEKKKIFIVISPTAITDYRINLLKLKPDKESLELWKNETYSDSGVKATKGVKDTVHLIQKRLDVNNIKEIVHDVKRILEPGKHPF